MHQIARSARPLATILAVGALVFGVVVRVILWTRDRPLWLDEQMISLNLRGRDYAGLTHALENQQSAPLGWLWLQRFMVVTFGTGELSLRFVPLIFGVGTVVVAFLTGRAFFGPVGAAALTVFTSANVWLLGYSAQVKHYSADTFFSFLLIGLALWLLRDPANLRRWTIWWAVAAVGSVMSIGAFLAAPGLFLVLIVVTWRQAGLRRAALASVIGVVWLAALLANYLLALGSSAAGNEYLYGFWSAGFAPANPLQFPVWLVKSLLRMAENPLFLGAGIGDGGRIWSFAAGVPFWLLVAAGILLAWRRRTALGLLFAAPIISAVLLATLHLVPLMARLALWVVPALFVAVAFALDAAAGALATSLSVSTSSAKPGSPPVAAAARPDFSDDVGKPTLPAGSVSPSRWSPPRAAVVGAATLALASLLAFVAYLPAAWTVAHLPGDHDDRAGIGYLQAIHQSGDLVLLVGDSSYGMVWYAPEGNVTPWRVVLSTRGQECHGALAEATKGFRRVLLYAGAVIPPWEKTPAAVTAELATLGRLVQTERFTGTSTVYVFDLTAAPDPAARSPEDCVYL
jgi:hypothetical protein